MITDKDYEKAKETIKEYRQERLQEVVQKVEILEQKKKKSILEYDAEMQAILGDEYEIYNVTEIVPKDA